MTDPEILKDIVLSHYKQPKNKQNLAKSDNVFRAKNPNCGDLYAFAIESDAGMLNITHDTQGCAAAVASSSILTEMLNGLSSEGALKFVRSFRDTFLNGRPLPEDTSVELEALHFFKQSPARVLCVDIAWETVENALVRPS